MKNKEKQIKKGILLAFVTSIISGVAIFYSKIAVLKIPPLILTTSRNLYVGFLFLLFFIFSKRFGEFKKLKKNQLILLILIGLIGGALPFYLFFTGLSMVKAQTANLIHKTLFIWVTILAAVFLKEKLNLSYFIAFILIFLGNFYFAQLPAVFGKGEFLILAATILWSVENILAKKVLKTVSSELVGIFRMGIGSLLLMIFVIVYGKGKMFFAFDFQKLTVILIGGTILFFYVYFWYKALKYAPASLVTLILSFSVVVGNILNGAFAGIKIVQRDFYSSLLISVSLFLIFFVQFKNLKDFGKYYHLDNGRD